MDLGKLGDMKDMAEKIGMDIPDVGDLVGKLDIPNVPMELITEAFAILKKEGPGAAIMHVIKELMASGDESLKGFGGVLKSTLGDKVKDIGIDDATKILEKLKK